MKKLFFFLLTFFSSALVLAQCNANAGPDVYLCPGNGVVVLNGTGFTTSGSIQFQWFTSGTGTFVPNAATYNGNYALSAADKAAGVTMLYLRITDPDNGCQATDTLIVFWNLCAPGGMVTGMVFEDLNENGVQDIGENGIPNKMLYIDNPSGYIDYGTFTDANGYYELRLPNGSSKIVTTLNTAWSYTFPSSHTYTVTIADDTVTNKNFGMKLIPGIREVSVRMYTWPPRPGYSSYYFVWYKNNGSAVLDGTIDFKYDPALVFQSSYPVGYLHNSGTQTVSYNYTNLFPGEERYIGVSLGVPESITLGTNLLSSSQVTVTGGDVYSGDNYDTLNIVTVGSFDPNDKQVKPEGGGAEHYIYSDDDLTYTIRFQNTGTAEAYKIVVDDTLDTDLDLRTFKMIAASHTYTLSFKPDGLVRWTFDNIMLPDSNTNESQSHGFISFRIAQKSDNPDGTEIRNRAAIYFDYNYPVITNQTLNTIGENILLSYRHPSFSYTESLHIYPNPASDHFYIEGNSKILRYQVLLLDGKVVSEGSYAGSVEISTLSKGVYILKVISERSVQYRKILLK